MAVLAVANGWSAWQKRLGRDWQSPRVGGGQQTAPPPSLYKVPTYSTRAGTAPRAPGGARQGGGNRAVTSQPPTGQSPSYGDVKPSYGGAGG